MAAFLTVASGTGAAPAGGFSFNLSQTAGSGDNKPLSTVFSTPFKPTATAAPTGLGVPPAKTSAPPLTFGTPTAQTPQAGGLTFGLGKKKTPMGTQEFHLSSI